MKEKKRAVRRGLALGLLGLGSLFFLFCNLLYGSVSISFQDILSIFSGNSAGETYERIVMDIRFPRALAACLLGGALALSGYLLQTFFHNPIAGPFVLGISSGSKLTVAVVMVFLLGRSLRISSGILVLAAFLGALLSMGFVLLLWEKVNQVSLLVISGVMIGYICSAVTDLIVTFADEADIVNLHNWSKGSFSGMSWGNVSVMAVILSVTVLFVFFLSKPISAYQLGEEYAGNLGVNLSLLRLGFILLSSILSACVVAYAGPISFVGIAVPHLVKILIQTKEPLWMIPGSFLGGSMFCLGCDLIARTVFAPTELSISTVTAIFGAPVVLWVMAGRRKE